MKGNTKSENMITVPQSRPKSEEAVPISPLEVEEKRDKQKENRQIELENEQLKEKNRQLESNIEQLTNKNRQLESNIEQLNNFLSALKEKKEDIEFIGFDDYKEESEIGEGATSSVKIVVKKACEKYAMKELKEFDHKTFKRFLKEAEILFKLRHPCIIRI